MARGASADVLAAVVGELRARYTSDDGGVEDDTRLTVATFMRELLRVATDAMNRVRTDWLPLVFVGKHEPRSQAEMAKALTGVQREEQGRLAELWQEMYDEAGIGPSLLTLHLPEISALLGEVVRGPSWALRRAAAFALLELRSKLSAEAIARQPQQQRELGETAVMLHEKKWRDKEGAAASDIEKHAQAHAPPASVPAPAAAAAAAAAAEGATPMSLAPEAGDGADSGDF